MLKKRKKAQLKSKDTVTEVEQSGQTIMEQVEGLPNGKKPAKFRKASDDTNFQMELTAEYLRSMGRWL